MSRNRDVPDISAADAAYMRAIVLHEDNAMIAFNKPSGLAVQAGSGVARSLDTLLAVFAKSNGKRPRLVHRLDQGTSGVIIAAKTQPVAAMLSEAFAGRAVTKTYIALVKGRLPPSESGIVDAALVKVEEAGKARMILARPDRKGAQAARTGWRVLARAGAYGALQLTPETGRMHQIRVHLMALGCPILGDALYGEGQATAPRLMLHAAKLDLPHPEGGRCVIEAPLPDDLRATGAASGVHTGL